MQLYVNFALKMIEDSFGTPSLQAFIYSEPKAKTVSLNTKKLRTVMHHRGEFFLEFSVFQFFSYFFRTKKEKANIVKQRNSRKENKEEEEIGSPSISSLPFTKRLLKLTVVFHRTTASNTRHSTSDDQEALRMVQDRKCSAT